MVSEESRFELISNNPSIPEKASSGRTRRSRSSGFALDKTESARFKLLLTSPTWGANCKHPILISTMLTQPRNDNTPHPSKGQLRSWRARRLLNTNRKEEETNSRGETNPKKNEADIRSAGYKEDADAKPTQPTQPTANSQDGVTEYGETRRMENRQNQCNGMGPVGVYWGRWL